MRRYHQIVKNNWELMCFGNLNLLVTQQQLNKVIPIMWWLITMPVIKIPKLHSQVKEQFKGTGHI